MNVLAIIHHDVAPAGVFADAVAGGGHALSYWAPSAEPIPRPLGEFDAVLAFGGGMNPDEDDLHPWLSTAVDALRTCLSRGIPTLGVCLGGQLLARAAGAAVRPAPAPENGWFPVELTDDGLGDPLFAGLPRQFDVFQWHTYEFDVPPGGVLLARSELSPQCVRIGEVAWGLQWHPEVRGESILQWAAEYPPIPQPGAEPFDLERFRLQVQDRIAATNDAGRDLCARFLALAAP